MRDCDYYPVGAGLTKDEIEIWNPIPGFEDRYEISNIGRVKSIGIYNTCKRGILRPMKDPCGYYHVVLYKDCTKTDISIHRLVALSFVDNPNPTLYKYVNHIDKNIKNNRTSNLEWCTNSYNLAYSNGKRVCQYSKDGAFISEFNCIADASREFHIPATNISNCCKGERHTAGGYIWRYKTDVN